MGRVAATTRIFSNMNSNMLAPSNGILIVGLLQVRVRVRAPSNGIVIVGLLQVRVRVRVRIRAPSNGKVIVGYYRFGHVVT